MTDEEFHTLLEKYHTRFGVRMGIPFGWVLEDVAEAIREALADGVAIPDDRFHPPPGADS